jgi:hypothetical protein
LGAEPEVLTHVGTDPAVDGGVEAAGGRFVDLSGDAPIELQ